MLTEYIPIAILIALATGLAFLVVGLGHLFGPRRPSARKGMPYESGMAPIGPGTRRLPVRFYLVAVLFILFDIEIVFLYPWAATFGRLGLLGLVEMGLFVVVLVLGLAYAWAKGALEWQ